MDQGYQKEQSFWIGIDYKGHMPDANSAPQDTNTTMYKQIPNAFRACNFKELFAYVSKTVKNDNTASDSEQKIVKKLEEHLQTYDTSKKTNTNKQVIFEIKVNSNAKLAKESRYVRLEDTLDAYVIRDQKISESTETCFVDYMDILIDLHDVGGTT